MSTIEIGTMFCGDIDRVLGQPETTAIVDAMYEEGINIVDTAHLYGQGNSERALGEALKGRRDQMIIVTKGGHEGQRHADPDKGIPSLRILMRDLEGSLKNLQTDYVDLYMYHNGGGDLDPSSTRG